MIKNSFFIAAAVAGLFASSITAHAATCPVTGATSGEKTSESKKEASKEDCKDSAKAGEGKEKSGGCSGCPSKGKK